MCFKCGPENRHCAKLGYPSIEYMPIAQKYLRTGVKFYLNTGSIAPFCRRFLFLRFISNHIDILFTSKDNKRQMTKWFHFRIPLSIGDESSQSKGCWNLGARIYQGEPVWIKWRSDWSQFNSRVRNFTVQIKDIG